MRKGVAKQERAAGTGDAFAMKINCIEFIIREEEKEKKQSAIWKVLKTMREEL